jgi:hypothetical protein
LQSDTATLWIEIPVEIFSKRIYFLLSKELQKEQNSDP